VDHREDEWRGLVTQQTALDGRFHPAGVRVPPVGSRESAQSSDPNVTIRTGNSAGPSAAPQQRRFDHLTVDPDGERLRIHLDARQRIIQGHISLPQRPSVAHRH
jgi:hypothetical protein